MRTLILLGLLAIASRLPAAALLTIQLPLTGRVVDGSSGTPLEYATVSAFGADSVLVDGTITGADGRFSLLLPAADYRLVIEFIGFGKEEMNVSHVGEEDLGDLTLSTAGVDLEAVEVRAAKSSMNLHLDKKVFNVGSDALAQGGSANQVLSQVPAVAVSAEGAVSLRGNASVKILINGRPSALADNNSLDAIPASSIERIEVITNPSARYEAAGSAGIINIILKKERSRGYGGSVTVGTGYPADHQLLLNLNVRREKFSAFANLGARYSNYRAEGELTRTSTLEGATTKLLRIPSMDRNDRAVSGYAGFDFYPNEQTTITGSYSVYDVVNDDITLNDYFYTDGSDRPIRDLRQQQPYLEPGFYEQADAIYTRELKQGKLSVQLNHDAWNETETESVLIDELTPNPDRVVSYRTLTEESSRDYRLQSDYSRSLGTYGNLETGIRLETRIISSDYIAENEEADGFAVIPGFKNSFDYFERIGSAYFQYAYQKEKVGVQLGLRNEYTAIRTENSDEDMTNIRKSYNKLFPSASFKYEITETASTQLSYSRRIRRPYFGQLNPFAGLRLPTNVFFGNPDLDPSYTDRLELNLVANWEKVTVNPAIYVSTTTNYFQEVIEQEPGNIFGLNDGTIISGLANLERQNDYGIELTASYRPNEVVNLSGDFLYRGYQQRGQLESRSFDFDFATWSASLRGQANLPKEITAQLRFVYEARRKDVQSINYGYVGAEFGLSKQFGEHFTLSSNVRSPQYFKSDTFRPTFRQEDYFQWTGWRYGLSLAYKFERGAGSDQRRGRGSIR